MASIHTWRGHREAVGGHWCVAPTRLTARQGATQPHPSPVIGLIGVQMAAAEFIFKLREAFEPTRGEENFEATSRREVSSRMHDKHHKLDLNPFTHPFCSNA